MIARILCLACGLALAGCQNAPQQLSLYAPFGPAVVPAPNLARVNAAPYYSAVGESKPAGPTASSAETSNAQPSNRSDNTSDNSLSHYDPYRGILLPGNYTPTPVALRSNAAQGTSDSAPAATMDSSARPSGEEPIKIVENSPKGLGSAIDSTIAKATEGQRSGSTVQFQPSPPSGVVRSVEAVPAVIKSSPVSELARLPKATSTPATTPNPPAGNVPNLLTPLPLGPPPAASPAVSPASPASPNIIPAKPAEARPLSLWNEPRDGSRVEPASYSGAVLPMGSTPASGAWRQRTP